MAQYKHDRFFKLYIQSLYKTKGNTQQNIQVRNDEDLEIDLMFMGDRSNPAWEEEDLGLFDQLMEEHPTIVVEHYSAYLEATDILKSITRKNLYWEPKQKELVEAARVAQKLTPSKRLSKEATSQIENQNPFTWILTVNCSENLLKLCGAQPDPALGVGVYRLVGLLRMGIVVISKVADVPEAMWLKMLGDRESATEALGSLEQLSSDRREKTAIIKACKKYFTYLKGLSPEKLSSEDEDFMITLAEIDTLYDAEMNQAVLKGEARGKELEKHAIVLNMRSKNVPLETIAEYTGLTTEEIERLLSLSN
jgi:hypothetical protein